MCERSGERKRRGGPRLVRIRLISGLNGCVGKFCLCGEVVVEIMTYRKLSSEGLGGNADRGGGAFVPLASRFHKVATRGSAIAFLASRRGKIHVDGSIGFHFSRVCRELGTCLVVGVHGGRQKGNDAEPARFVRRLSGVCANLRSLFWCRGTSHCELGTPSWGSHH